MRDQKIWENPTEGRTNKQDLLMNCSAIKNRYPKKWSDCIKGKKNITGDFFLFYFVEIIFIYDKDLLNNSITKQQKI